MQTSINKLGFNIFWNIFFSLKLPSFLSNITKLRLLCLQNRSVLTNFGLMIFITIGFLFCWDIYRVSDWTFKIKQGWETHTKGLSQILPNKSRWILPFLRSQNFLRFLYPWDNLPNSFDKLTGNIRISNFWRSQIERKYNCFVYNV